MILVMKETLALYLTDFLLRTIDRSPGILKLRTLDTESILILEMKEVCTDLRNVLSIGAVLYRLMSLSFLRTIDSEVPES